MTWFFIALSCAFLTACCDATSKRIMQDHDEWLTGTVILGLASMILLPVFLSLDLKPVSFKLVALMTIVLPLEILGYYLFLSAIRMGALSLTVPLLAFTPVLTILTSALLVGEHISLKGGFGIGLVTLGAYVLNADLMTQNLMAPIKALFSNPGSRRMFLVAVIWSVTSALGKIGVLIYDPIPFGFILLFGDLVIFALVCLFRARTGRAPINLRTGVPGLFLLGGLLMAGAEITHVVSLSMAPVAYMISVKRLSLVFGVILGRLFFREHNIRYRLIGATVMVAGVFFIYG
jgi:drug/metabolite transporter (DMT)-like permease